MTVKSRLEGLRFEASSLVQDTGAELLLHFQRSKSSLPQPKHPEGFERKIMLNEAQNPLKVRGVLGTLRPEVVASRNQVLISFQSERSNASNFVLFSVGFRFFVNFFARLHGSAGLA